MSAIETNDLASALGTGATSHDDAGVTVGVAKPSMVLGRSDAPAGEAADPSSRDPSLLLERPAAGQTSTIAWIVGTAITFGFDLGDAKIVAADGVTAFVFADGATLRVYGLELGGGDLPETPVTLADGAVIKLGDLGALAEITPAAGNTLSASPAAGNAPPGNQGHATIPPEPGDVGDGLIDTGALLYTELSFSATSVNGDTVENILEEGGASGPLTISIADAVRREGNPSIIEMGAGGAGEGEGAFELVDDPGTVISFLVSLSAQSAEAVSVSYNVVPGSANPGDAGLHEGDYSPLDSFSGVIVFAPGEVSKLITLNIVDDIEFEETESFTVVLSEPVGASLAKDNAIGTILDDDVPLEVDGEGEIAFAALLDGPPGGAETGVIEGVIPSGDGLAGFGSGLPPLGGLDTDLPPPITE